MCPEKSNRDGIAAHQFVAVVCLECRACACVCVCVYLFEVGHRVCKKPKSPWRRSHRSPALNEASVSITHPYQRVHITHMRLSLLRIMFFEDSYPLSYSFTFQSSKKNTYPSNQMVRARLHQVAAAGSKSLSGTYPRLTLLKAATKACLYLALTCSQAVTRQPPKERPLHHGSSGQGAQLLLLAGPPSPLRPFTPHQPL